MHPRIRLELAKRWSEPHREHHDTDHLIEVLGALRLLSEDGLEFDLDVANAAAWFHDAVYDLARADNVERSAFLASTWLDEPLADRVAEVVMATRDHKPDPADHEAVALCDADLSVLGQEPLRYEQYARALRREYAHVPTPQYRRLRAAALTRYLRRPELFHSAQGRACWEECARDNMARELMRLGSPIAV